MGVSWTPVGVEGVSSVAAGSFREVGNMGQFLVGTVPSPCTSPRPTIVKFYLVPEQGLPWRQPRRPWRAVTRLRGRDFNLRKPEPALTIEAQIANDPAALALDNKRRPDKLHQCGNLAVVRGQVGQPAHWHGELSEPEGVGGFGRADRGHGGGRVLAHQLGGAALGGHEAGCLTEHSVSRDVTLAPDRQQQHIPAEQIGWNGREDVVDDPVAGKIPRRY